MLPDNLQHFFQAFQVNVYLHLLSGYSKMNKNQLGDFFDN